MTGSGDDLSGFSMLDLFRMEAESQCSNLTGGLLDLERDPTSPEMLESLMRAAHSIKGAARIVELDRAVQLAHVMENVFVAAQQGKVALGRSHIDLLLSAVDMFISMSNVTEEEMDAWLEKKASEIDRLVDALTAISEGRSLSADSSQEPAVDQSVPESGDGHGDEETDSEIKAGEQVHGDNDKDSKVDPITRKDRYPDVSSHTEGGNAGPGTGRPTLKKANGNAIDRAVRISADSLDRLMGLSGEVLIESHWLPAFSEKMLRLKHCQDDMLRELERLREVIEVNPTNTQLKIHLLDVRKKAEKCQILFSNYLAEIEDHASRSTYHSHCLYQEVIASRMRPFSDGIQGFPRMVRDLARELGKEVRFEIIGSETLADRDILEKIKAPLNHLLRNAVDHGVEAPEERKKAGKPVEALITLEASHKSGMLNIVISDDGRGVDLDALRRSVVDKNLVSKEMADTLTEDELLEFLFLPSFSTRKRVNKVSGRGVGLDVVRSMVQEVRGTVRIFSVPGKGVRFELQLPLTLSVVRALLAEVAGEPYAFPLAAINCAIMLPSDEIEELEGRQYLIHNGKRIGLVYARQVFEKREEEISDSLVSVILLSDRNSSYGLLVDGFLGVKELVVQTLNLHMGKVQDISAAAMLENGAPVLIVDVEDLVRTMDGLISGNTLKKLERHVGPDSRKVKRILVVDDSITVREVERKLLTSKGYSVDVAVDGMDGWNAVRNGRYDLVITDVDMPRMDGIELVSLIKADPGLNTVPVVIVSYKDREEDRNRGLEAGADFYLTKGSFHDESFVEAVRDLIGNP